MNLNIEKCTWAYAKIIIITNLTKTYKFISLLCINTNIDYMYLKYKKRDNIIVIVGE